MRRQHPVRPKPRLLRQVVQGIGIDDQRPVAGEYGLGQFFRFDGL
jgi:hypothetical protein